MAEYKLKTGKVGEAVVNGYKKIENGVVDGYKAIEKVSLAATRKSKTALWSVSSKGWERTSRATTSTPKSRTPIPPPTIHILYIHTYTPTLKHTKEL